MGSLKIVEQILTNLHRKQLNLHIVVWRPLKGYLASSADPDQMPQNAASDQGLHCLQIV